MMFLYSAALAVGLVLSAPWWLLRMFTTERYREGLGERLGRVPARLRETVASRRVVWLHAVSVGEVLAASRLVGELEAALNAGTNGAGSSPWLVVVSTTTRTGQALARERFGAERVFYFPLDFAWAVRAYLRALRPAALVLMESELWPRVLHECSRGGVPVAVVNARVSDRSFSRGMRVRALWGRVLRKVNVWLMQSEEDARRIVAMGALEDAVRVGGNLKYDVRAPKETAATTLLRRLIGERPLVVAGSTTAAPNGTDDNDEEEDVVDAWRTVRKAVANAVLLIAPRHPERFARAIGDMSVLRVRKATDLLADEAAALASAGHIEAICLDTIGDLASVYSLAAVAFVGGSLVRNGGHNPLEPAQFGVPVIMGPSFENFRDIVEEMRRQSAICVLDDPAELAFTLTALLREREASQAMGERGLRVFDEQGGATARAITGILEMMDGMQGASQ